MRLPIRINLEGKIPIFMMRFRHLRFGLLSAIAVGAFIVAPASAQFGPIFNDEPPRPPANVPGEPLNDRQFPPFYPSERTDPVQIQPQRRPPPQRSGPSGGRIQSQDLAPPPGTVPPPEAAQPQVIGPGQVEQDQQLQPGEQIQQDSNIVRTTPGLPPGIRQPTGQPQVEPPPSNEVVVAPPPVKIANPTAVFSGLDKITGRIISFDVAINETVQFGALQVTPRVCYSRPPTETPTTDSFVEVDEVTLQGDIKRIFSGWMFAASPGLHAVEHPVYDVWLTDCKGGQNDVANQANKQDGAISATRAQQKRIPRRPPPR
jgi:hypothetical protein